MSALTCESVVRVVNRADHTTYGDTCRSVTALNRYHDALQVLPPSGGGGCHAALLGTANLGRRAGLSPDQIAKDLADHVHGTRKIPDREIRAAVSKAFDSSSTEYTSTLTATPRPKVDGAKLLAAIIGRGVGLGEADLWESSPVRIDWPPEHDAFAVLRRLYEPSDRLFAGTRYAAGVECVLPVSQWIEQFECGVAVPEHIIPNPLTGQPSQTKDGKISHRADNCVARFKFAVVEFDAMPRPQQIQFWAGVLLPVVALIDSGGKSVHGWVKVNAGDTVEWTRRVEEKLFHLLTAVGADGACKNEARLSRMPGHYRAEKERWQRLLYLNPAGGPIIP